MSFASSGVAVVTGAGSGIGRALAQRLSASGSGLAIADLDEKGLLETAASLPGKASAVSTHVLDVSDEEAVRAFAADVAERHKRVTLLINNAGVALFTPLMETSDADWHRVMEVNLTGPFLCTKAAVPSMRDRGSGAIVNITSISGLRASTLRSAYGTSKAGLAHLTKQLAVELAGFGIRVNGVAPGPVDTAMAKAVHSPEIRADYHDAIPLNRYGLEEERAEAIFFLCSDRASYITGQILAVDGGFDAAGIGLPALRGAGRNG